MQIAQNPLLGRAHNGLNVFPVYTLSRRKGRFQMETPLKREAVLSALHRLDRSARLGRFRAAGSEGWGGPSNGSVPVLDQLLGPYAGRARSREYFPKVLEEKNQTYYCGVRLIRTGSCPV